jgi:hypothetical protein
VLLPPHGPFGQAQATFFSSSQTKYVEITQNLSQKLAPEGNADPSNAAALLHALHLGPTKDVTMCYCHLIVHLAKHRQLFSAAARPNMWK